MFIDSSRATDGKYMMVPMTVRLANGSKSKSVAR